MFEDISVGLGSGLIATDIFVGGGPRTGTRIVSFPCTEGCAGPNAIFSDGFESGDLSRAALDAGEVFVLVRTTAGDLGGFLQPVVVNHEEMLLEGLGVSWPAGLSLQGWCDRPIDSFALIAANPALQGVAVLGDDGKFVVDDARLPRSARRAIAIEFGMGMFVRTTEPLDVMIDAGTMGSDGGGPFNAVYDGDTLTLEMPAGLSLIGNCGDAATNTALLSGNPGTDRMWTYDELDHDWTGVGQDLPPALRQEVEIPNAPGSRNCANSKDSVR